jgi:glycosyltransferase involved in cell wall biosynthesis
MRGSSGEPSSAPPARRSGTPRPLNVAVIGMSTGTPCGVHEHATLLADALQEEGIASSLHWLWRSDGSFGASRAQVRDWTQRLSSELRGAEPDVVLLHYSVFAYSFRGLPVFVRPVLSVVADLGVPMVTLLHEYAYPWRRGGVRGTGWALSQRALLFEVMRASAAVVATTDFRADWLTTQRWLPRRPTVLAPVFSSLPAGHGDSAHRHEPPRIGLFGYAHEGVNRALVLDAMHLLEERGVQAELLLVGAPGRESAAGEAWLAAAREHGLERPPAFSGMLAAEDLANVLARCDLLLAADRIGPTSRRTTLAASLAAGAPVVVLDGRHSWSELRESGAALFVEPAAEALADALAELLGDEQTRTQLAQRGPEFATRAMSAERSARVVGRALREVLGMAPHDAAAGAHI